MNKKRWEKSKYSKKIRISEENLDFLRMMKGKKCMAGKLNEIINKYRSEQAKSENKSNEDWK